MSKILNNQMNILKPYLIWFIAPALSCAHIIDPSEAYQSGEVAIKVQPCGTATLYLISSAIKHREKQLNLYTIQNGFDSLQIRIWFKNRDLDSDSTDYLLILKKYPNRAFETVLVNLNYPVIGGETDIDEPPVVSFRQLKFSDSIYKFIDLSMDSLMERGGVEIGCRLDPESRTSDNGIIIEVAKDLEYFVGQFPTPGSFRPECGSAEKELLRELLNLLHKEYKLPFVKDYLK
jgi:hypothetical protein